MWNEPSTVAIDAGTPSQSQWRTRLGGACYRPRRSRRSQSCSIPPRNPHAGVSCSNSSAALRHARRRRARGSAHRTSRPPTTSVASRRGSPVRACSNCGRAQRRRARRRHQGRTRRGVRQAGGHDRCGAMLRRLEGRAHQVITVVWCISAREERVVNESTVELTRCPNRKSPPTSPAASRWAAPAPTRSGQGGCIHRTDLRRVSESVMGLPAVRDGRPAAALRIVPA